MDATHVNFLAAAGQFLLVAGLAFAVVCILTSALRFQHMASQAHRPAAESGTSEQAFLARIAHRMGTAHRSPPSFCVMLFSPGLAPSPVNSQDPEAADEILGLLETCIMQSVRDSDTVVRCNEKHLGVIVTGSRARGEQIAQRIRSRWTSVPSRNSLDRSRRGDLAFGLANYPEDGDRAHVLHARAVETLQAALSGGSSMPRPDIIPAVTPSASVENPSRRGGPQDDVTGVLSEDRVEAVVQKLVAQYRRANQSISLLQLDVEYIERYKQHYGPEAGDAVLKGLAEILKRGVREDDFIGRHRHGFLIAMACSPQEAQGVGQRLGSVIKKTVVDAAGHKLRVTVNMGVAGCPAHGSSGAQLVEATEAALRVAHTKGRGLCVVYDSTMNPGKERGQTVDAF